MKTSKLKMERHLLLAHNGDYCIILHAYPYNLGRKDYGKYEWRYKFNPSDKSYEVIPSGNSYESFVGARELMQFLKKTIYIYCHVQVEGMEFDTKFTCIHKNDTFDSQFLNNKFEYVGTFDKKGNGDKTYHIEE